MPGRDKTGPLKVGARTGKGLGACTGVNAPIGFKRGFMGGSKSRIKRGLGRNFSRYQASAESHKESLKEQRALLQNQLESIDRQLKNL